MGYFSDLAITEPVDSGWDRFDETNAPGVPVTDAGFAEEPFPSGPISVMIPDGPRELPITLTAWRYADLRGHAASREWRAMGTPNCNGFPVDLTFVTGEMVARWRDGIVSLRCADGFVYQFTYQPASI